MIVSQNNHEPHCQLFKELRKVWFIERLHDTPIPVKSKKRKGSTYNGYLWVYLDQKYHPDELHPRQFGGAVTDW